MKNVIKKRNRNPVIKLSIVTALSLISCISLIKIAADRPESPEFCARCHSMVSSYNTWKETVACNTGCLNCHTHDNGGKTLAVEIKDSNCTSIECHPLEKLVSETSQYKKIISFKHETHIKEYATNLRMQCTGCHIYAGKDGQKGIDIKHFNIDENTCIICHFTKSNNLLISTQDKKNIDECSLCHKEVQIRTMIYGKEFDHLKYEKELNVECTNCHFETVHRNNSLDKMGCYYCHTKVPKEYTGADRMHNDHVKEHKVPCSPCHNEIQHKWDDEYVRFVLPEREVDVQNKYLIKIANIDKGTNLNNLPVSPEGREHVFDDEPYLLQKRIYNGIHGRGVEGSPDPMCLATVNCIACHREKDLGVDPMVCNTCHEKGFDKTMLEQKEYVTRMLKELSDKLTESQKQEIPKYLIDEARHNYDMIVNDGSYGVHNIKYVKDLIAHSIDILESSLKVPL
jgi:hypothetical protein